MGPTPGKQPFPPTTMMKPKFLDRVIVPEKKVDDALISKLFLYIDEGIPSKIKQFVTENRLLLNIRNELGQSPIHAIISSREMLIDDKINMVKFLLLRGASAVAFDKYNVTPLHLAVKYQIPDLVDILLKYGADPNSLDSNNMNALHYAVIGMSIDCPSENKDKDIIPREKKDKPVTEETRIIQSLINNVNLFLFKWIEPQRYFKNIYNNIANYNELYKKELEVNKEDLSKKILDIINNKSIDIDKKQDMVQNEVNKSAENLKSIFMKDIQPALVDLSNYYEYDDTSNNIIINKDKFSPEKQEELLLQNVSRASEDLIKVADSLKEKVDENKTKIMSIREALINIRWLNKTLVINYERSGVRAISSAYFQVNNILTNMNIGNYPNLQPLIVGAPLTNQEQCMQL